MTDRKVVLVVAVALSVLAFTGFVGLIYLAAVNRPPPDQLGTLTAGAVGAIAALLVSTRSEPPGPPA